MINFIAKPPFEIRHLQRVSSIIRGEQISAYMGNARLNPPDGDPNDVYVYVKPHIKKGSDYTFEKHSWVDIQDGWDLVETIKKYPEVGVISYGDLAFKTLSEHLKNRIVNIPHHHVNFERNIRNRDKIKKVGVTGSGRAWEHIPQELKDGLKKRGIELAYHSSFYPRMSVARFYGSLDVHMHWRPFVKRKLSAPFKIINAASFGIPTIALDEPSFSEVSGTYIPVKTTDEWLKAFDLLQIDNKLYSNMSEFCIHKAEKYHISKIAELYRKLT